jgi:hypothetical protein
MDFIIKHRKIITKISNEATIYPNFTYNPLLAINASLNMSDPFSCFKLIGSSF